METIGARIKHLRKTRGLTQIQFGEKVGIAQGHLTSIENDKKIVTEKTLKVICSTFNINEDWLRTGEGDMENISETFSLDEFAQKRNMSDIDLKIIKAYLELDPDVRKVILSTFKNALSDDREDKEEVKEKVDNVIGFIESNTNYTKEDDDPKSLSTPKVAEEVGNYTSKSVEELEEEYKKNVLKNVPKQVVSVSSGIEDVNKVI